MVALGGTLRHSEGVCLHTGCSRTHPKTENVSDTPDLLSRVSIDHNQEPKMVLRAHRFGLGSEHIYSMSLTSTAPQTVPVVVLILSSCSMNLASFLHQLHETPVLADSRVVVFFTIYRPKETTAWTICSHDDGKSPFPSAPTPYPDSAHDLPPQEPARPFTKSNPDTKCKCLVADRSDWKWAISEELEEVRPQASNQPACLDSETGNTMRHGGLGIIVCTSPESCTFPVEESEPKSIMHSSV